MTVPRGRGKWQHIGHKVKNYIRVKDWYVSLFGSCKLSEFLEDLVRERYKSFIPSFPTSWHVRTQANCGNREDLCTPKVYSRTCLLQ